VVRGKGEPRPTVALMRDLRGELEPQWEPRWEGRVRGRGAIVEVGAHSMPLLRGEGAERIHCAEGCTVLFWAAVGRENPRGTTCGVLSTNGGLTARPGIWIGLDDRDCRFDRTLRVLLTRGEVAEPVYSNAGCLGWVGGAGGWLPGRMQSFALSHGGGEPLRVWSGGELVAEIHPKREHSDEPGGEPLIGAGSTPRVTPGAFSLAGPIIVPRLLSGEEVAEVHARSLR
jgi:hypothetical protein